VTRIGATPQPRHKRGFSFLLIRDDLITAFQAAAEMARRALEHRPASTKVEIALHKPIE